ncbi:MAG TPA: hypothetical protein PKW42_11250, partial [bacterium]|nr:hypothetical protein [bacterium]
SSERLNKEGNSRLTIERLLECGNEKAVRWLCRNYIGSEIMPLLKESRAFTFLKNVFFWAWYFQLPQEQVRCWQRDYRKKARAVWFY